MLSQVVSVKEALGAPIANREALSPLFDDIENMKTVWSELTSVQPPPATHSILTVSKAGETF